MEYVMNCTSGRDFTVRRHVMQTHGIAVAFLPVCLSVKREKKLVQKILIPHKISFILVF